MSELNCHVSEYGWPETLAPPLDKLCSLCKAIDSWTAADPNNVAVLHSCGSSDRFGASGHSQPTELSHKSPPTHTQPTELGHICPQWSSVTHPG